MKCLVIDPIRTLLVISDQNKGTIGNKVIDIEIVLSSKLSIDNITKKTVT